MKSLFASVLLLTFAAAPALAQETSQVFGGATSVKLSETFIDALGERGVEPGAIKPAYLKRGKAVFPISGGALDLADEYRGEIFHVGGLTLEAGDTTVGLLNFVIDTTGPGTPVLTGQVTVNGALVGRLPLFDLMPNEEPELLRFRILVVRNVGVTLTQVAADTLNEVFGLEGTDLAIPGGLDIGVAKVITRASRPFGQDKYDD